MIPVTILLLGIGGFSVYRSVIKEREENLAKEADKARDSLRGEYKRIFNEAQRDWSNRVSEHLKDQYTVIAEAVEQHLKSYFDQQAQGMKDQQARQKRQLQNLSSKQQNVQTAWTNSLPRAPPGPSEMAIAIMKL